MKPRNIYKTLQLAAVALAVAACSQDDLEVPGGTTSGDEPIAITIIDEGYANADTPARHEADAPATRAVENGYRTGFTEGDACGLYIVRDGNIVESNLKLTAENAVDTDGQLTWVADKSLYHNPNYKYFVYYPYQQNMEEKVSASANTDADFFATFIEDWQPQADQRTYKAYTASDLMTAKGNAKREGNKLALSFSMSHRMAMAVIEMPKTVYQFTNNDDGAIPDYIVPASGDFTGGSVQPYGITPGTYRYIVNPNSPMPTLTGSYADGKKEFSITPNHITASSYKTYKVDGAPTIEKEYNLQPGDYFLADGNLVGKDETLTDEQCASVIGIVFHAGHHEKDDSNYSSTGIGQTQCHGYAVALTDVRSCRWAYKDDTYSQNAGTSTNTGDWKGYSNQKAIENFANTNTYDWEFKHFEAAYRCSLYGTENGETWQRQYAAPVNTSGWFLPSCNQLTTLYSLNRDNANLLATSMDNVKSQDSNNIRWFSGYYWSSAENLQNVAWLVEFDSGDTYSSVKNNMYGVRAVLAF